MTQVTDLVHEGAETVDPEDGYGITGDLSQGTQRGEQKDGAAAVGEDQAEREIEPESRWANLEEIRAGLAKGGADFRDPICVCLLHLAGDTHTVRRLRTDSGL